MNTKTEGKSYTKVTRFYFRACSPLFIRPVNQPMKKQAIKMLQIILKLIVAPQAIRWSQIGGA